MDVTDPCVSCGLLPTRPRDTIYTHSHSSISTLSHTHTLVCRPVVHCWEGHLGPSQPKRARVQAMTLLRPGTVSRRASRGSAWPRRSETRSQVHPHVRAVRARHHHELSGSQLLELNKSPTHPALVVAAYTCAMECQGPYVLLCKHLEQAGLWGEAGFMNCSLVLNTTCLWSQRFPHGPTDPWARAHTAPPTCRLRRL